MKTPVNLMLRTLLLSWILGGASSLMGQKIDKTLLCQTWLLDKYSDEEAYFDIPVKEAGDFLRLDEDMTFQGQTEGEAARGTWMLNQNGQYLELKYDDEKMAREKIYIYFLTARSLVLGYDEDEYRALEAHYVGQTP